MGSASNVYENNLLDAILGAGFVKDPTVYVGLCTGNPGDATPGVEPVGNNYARVAVTNNATNWPAAADSQKKNGVVITFPAATASWGTLTHWILMNHPTGTASSNMIAWGELTPPLVTVTDDAPRFPVNALVLTAD